MGEVSIENGCERSLSSLAISSLTRCHVWLETVQGCQEPMLEPADEDLLCSGGLVAREEWSLFRPHFPNVCHSFSFP